ncbi:alpha/beta fold hydrolase [Catellatospora sp. NPDC049111]|uniref:alpha/beta fold hydrolase n=1 Tax=unclassified Catellatospora TaxID=2645785 RepID=UPI0033F50F63
MFRNLIPALADRYHVIAPDHLGYGQSAQPPVTEFDYTFDALGTLTAGLLDHIGVDTFAIYVHDYGAPIGWRLAMRTSPRAATPTWKGSSSPSGKTCSPTPRIPVPRPSRGRARC